jgi:hypothetical protein
MGGLVQTPFGALEARFMKMKQAVGLQTLSRGPAFESNPHRRCGQAQERSTVRYSASEDKGISFKCSQAAAAHHARLQPRKTQIVVNHFTVFTGCRASVWPNRADIRRLRPAPYLR